MRTTWTFHSAVSLVFGPGAVRQVGDIVRRLPARRVFVVTDATLAKVGVLAAVTDPLKEADVEVGVFDGGEPEPSLSVLERCVEEARKFRPDAVLGLGGGSNMDVSKGAAALLTHGGKSQDYVGDDRIPGPVMPVVCVPTTAGTGSEVTAAAVFTVPENHVKVGVLSNYLRPRVAVVDPELTRSCPWKVTADSGIDALTHAIEAYTAVDNSAIPIPQGERTVYQGKHPLGDCMAEAAIRLIGAHLRPAVANGNDLDAREGMALGATLAGLAFSNVGVAVVHALEYPVGGATHCSHGAGNGLLLPFVMRFNLQARAREYAAIARLLGEDVTSLDDRRAAEMAITAVEKLRREIGIPLCLRDLGVREDQLRPFAEKAFAIKRILRVNPRPVTAADLEEILRSAY